MLKSAVYLVCFFVDCFAECDYLDCKFLNRGEILNLLSKINMHY